MTDEEDETFAKALLATGHATAEPVTGLTGEEFAKALTASSTPEFSTEDRVLVLKLPPPPPPTHIRC